MILFILQNAYTSEKHLFKNEDEWYRELMRSHTGRRLKEMIPYGKDFRVVNSSATIGDNPNSIYPADINHICKMIDNIKPKVICACGKVAQAGCRKINIEKLKIDYIEAPHPAWRGLSKKIILDIRAKLNIACLTNEFNYL